MTNKNTNGTVAKARLNEHDVSKLEREIVFKLSEVLLVWHQKLGPGLDMVFAGLALLSQAADAAASAAEGKGATDSEIRAACTRAIALKLAVPKLPNARAQRAARIRALGGLNEAETDMAYEAKTLRLITSDFIAWYEEVGLGGFLNSLSGLVNVYAELFHRNLDDSSVERDKVFFLSAFELRQRFGKVPKEMLEALEFLGETHAEESCGA